MEQEQLETWIKTTAMHGLGFVLLSVLSAIFLYVIWRLAFHGVSVVATLREWLPLWFAAQMESHRAIVKSADMLTESLGGVRETLDQTHEGAAHIVRAMEAHVNGRRQDYGSDVVIHLTNAKKVLEKRE